MCETKLVDVTDTGVIVADKDGNQKTLPADTVITRNGRKAEHR